MRGALLALMPLLAAGCMSIKTTHDVKKEEIHVQMEASEDQLVAQYNEQARAVQTLQATVDLVPSTGSTYSGVIEEYHDVPGFILAKRPATVRVIGQAPVVAKNIFDMVSDGETFRIFIPSKNTFLVGSTSLSRTSKKPIENLRPQHVVDALFWPELPATAHVLFEQFDADPNRYYILTLLRDVPGGKIEIARKIWFDRVNLRVSRVQLYGAAGRLDSDIAYSDWQPIAAPTAGGAPSAATASYPRDLHIWRPQDDYKLEIRILKLTVNEEITADRFELTQPPGTDLVRVAEEQVGAQP
jgi:outer membrane lipoprotein-sorting protein